MGVALLTMNSFTAENYFFNRQIVWILVGVSIFFIFSRLNWHILKSSRVLAVLFLCASFILGLLFLVAPTRGAKSWLDFGSISFQPSDFIKILLILMLAKYFSRRHIEIAHFQHIFISGIYAFLPFVLVLLQPDFGSAIIIFFIWLGMVMVSGVSKKHLFLVFLVGLISFAYLWFQLFKPYQKDRLITFLNPLSDIRGAGYNVFQSQVAIGSGRMFGKGVGYGTQSRLEFLPEYQTDFIFAAFAEEWGFVGVSLIFILYLVIIWRILATAMLGAGNFEMLYGIGLAIFFIGHFVINVGMNIGLLPVTGLPLPFMSYGGSHILAEFMGLGILMGMRRYARAAHRDDMRNEFLGPA